MTRAAPGSEDGGSHLSAGALVLNCPGCGSQVAADASICSVCDYIIDSSFLSSEPPADNDEESTGASEDPRPPPPKPARPRPAGKSGARPAAPASADATNVKSVQDIARGAPQRPSRPAPATRAAAATAPKRTAPAPAPAPAPVATGSDPWARRGRDDEEGGNPIVDPEELMQDARDLMGAMSAGDKIAFYGSGLVVLSCFTPWKETAADGDALGLMSTGFGAFVLSLMVMVAIGVRVRSSFPNLNPVVPWMAQLFTTFVCLIWCIVFIKVSSDTTLVPTPIGNAEMMNSSPSFGVFIGLLGAVAALIGAFLGLKSKND
ncbi:hypothetical protein [Myxococcus eversor]|uniref:hypothetical protein n=1 Tax=Myxococcus eversor TaxID=2709661 RepID=UPI0013D8B6B8|nr:hypothetical protein [Myxococcus eversor]